MIYTLAILQAVSALVHDDVHVSRRFQIDQILLYVAAALWIVMAALDSSTLTFLALAIMLVVAVDGVLTLARSQVQPRRHRLITRAAFGLFAGWVSAAFFLNLATALEGWGLVEADDLGWQLVVVTVAALTLLALVLKTRLLAYAVAGIWAFVGIVVAGATSGTTGVIVAASVAALAVAVAAVVAVRSSVHRDGDSSAAS